MKVLIRLALLFSFSTMAMEDVPKEQALKQVMEKVAEGNNRISGSEEKAYLLLGNTGSGKSTLAHVLTGRKLQAISNDFTGEMLIDAREPLSDIVISHNKKSETKIPNKCLSHETINKCLTNDGVVIWDCPGFNDTDIAQQIANNFYIKNLFNLHKKIKFILVASEGSLADRGTLFASILQQFCNGFTDVELIKNSTILVITGVKPGKKIQHLKNTLNQILDENKSLTSEARKMLHYLLDKIVLFHMPINEGDLPENDIASLIDQMGEFVGTDSDLGKFSLSEKGKEYCQDLLEISANNLTQLAQFLFNTIKNANFRLENNHNTIKGWLPLKINYTPLYEPKSHTSTENFISIKQLKHLLATAEEIKKLDSNKLDEVAQLMEKFFNVLEEYVLIPTEGDHEARNALKEKIKHFAYATHQMKNYHKSFASLIKGNALSADSILSKKLYNVMNKFPQLLENRLKQAIISLEIDQSNTNIDYYQEAVDILQLNIENNKCIKNQAICNNLIGDAKNFSNNKIEAFQYYVKSLKLDKTNNSIYDKIGLILKSSGKLQEAIKFFRVVENTLELESCCKTLFGTCQTEAGVYENCGDMWLSLGQQEEAKKCFFNAKSLSNNNPVKIGELMQKIAECFKTDISSKFSQLYEEKSKNGQYYNYDSINLDEFTYN